MLKIILGFVAILILLGACIGAMIAVDEDPKASPPSTRNPNLRTSVEIATAEAKLATARARPTSTAKPSPWTNKYQATVPPTQQLKPTPTAINEAEHQLWLAWPDHYDDLQNLIEDMEKNANSIMADGILDSNDLINLCPAISGWEQRLDPIAKFMAEYRATDPSTIEENTPLQNMEEAVGVAHEHINNSKALCN